MVSTKPLTTFLILIDAWRWDKLNPVDTPFLFELSKKSRYGSLREPFVYQTRPAFIAGLDPEVSNIAEQFYLDPGDSLPKILKYCPDFGATFRRRVIDRLVRVNERHKGNFGSGAYGSVFNVPLPIAPFFGFSEKKLPYGAGYTASPTIFDLLKETGQTWLWLGYPTHNLLTSEVLPSFQTAFKYQDLVFLHFSETDYAEHRFGPDSKEYHEKLMEVDAVINQFVTANATNNFVIFGDHGAVTVKYHVDLWSGLDTLCTREHLKIGQDILFFLDSTRARFWFFNERSRRLVLDWLASVSGGRILTLEERRDLKINYLHHKFFEEMWVLDGPGLIFPNYYNAKTPELGMHGYLPNIKDNEAAYLVSEPGVIAESRDIQMKEIFGFLKDEIIDIHNHKN
ncbi:MAG: alkaline phosphatase family protein [candidate division WWE3 bacterium]|nr:alkaline phosphatase family protein [candidate division WWE3 bacterium]